MSLSSQMSAINKQMNEIQNRNPLIPWGNFTTIPNIILDQFMRDLSHAQFKILMAIARKTYGWNKASDRISLNQISEMTGVARSKIPAMIRALGDLVLAVHSPMGNVYSINFGEVPSGDQVVTSGDQGSDLRGLTIDNLKHTRFKKRENIAGNFPVDTGLSWPANSPAESFPNNREDANIAAVEKELPEQALELTTLLVDLIAANIPNYTRPSKALFRKWAVQCDLLHRRDHQSWHDIRETVEWCQQDEFWRANILSMSKLRIRWNQLQAQMKRGPRNEVSHAKVTEPKSAAALRRVFGGK